MALNIATTDSLGSGGNPWEFVKDDFIAAVEADPSPERLAALALLAGWDGHFVAGGESQWVWGNLRADATVTDVGSSKASVVAAASAALGNDMPRFVPVGRYRAGDCTAHCCVGRS